MYRYTEFDSVVGCLRLIANDHALIGVVWQQEHIRRLAKINLVYDDQDPLLQLAQQQLMQYFAGERKSFDLPLEAQGTPFQREVWQALTTIPYGETRSYKDIAQQIGKSLAMRAVGMANGQNPLSIIVPCHRVIGATGKLVGFGGGLDKKKQLLQLEQSNTLKNVLLYT